MSNGNEAKWMNSAILSLLFLPICNDSEQSRKFISNPA
jgi:hypothetical protein